MAVGFRSASNTGNDANQPSRSPAVPAGAAAGDVVVVFLSRWGTSNPAVTAPSGFTKWPTQYLSGDNAAKIDIFWKRLTAADTGSYTFSWTGGMWSSAEAVCFTGAIESGTPISAASGWSGTAGTFGATSVTVDDTGSGLAWNAYNDTNGTHTPPTGFTELSDNDCGSHAYRIPGTSGTHSASGGSVTSSSPAAAVLVAIEPQPSASESRSFTASLGLTVAPTVSQSKTVTTAATMGLGVTPDTAQSPTANLSATPAILLAVAAQQSKTSDVVASATALVALAATLSAAEQRSFTATLTAATTLDGGLSKTAHTAAQTALAVTAAAELAKTTGFDADIVTVLTIAAGQAKTAALTTSAALSLSVAAQLLKTATLSAVPGLLLAVASSVVRDAATAVSGPTEVDIESPTGDIEVTMGGTVATDTGVVELEPADLEGTVTVEQYTGTTGES